MHGRVEVDAGQLGGVLVLEDDGPGRGAFAAVAAAGAEAADPAEAVAHGQGRGDEIGRLPGRDLLAVEVPQGVDRAEGQAALEDAARPGQREELLGVADVVGDVAHEQDELGADERDDDGVEGGVHDLVGVEAGFLRLDVDEPQAQGDADGHHEAVGVDGQGADLYEDGEHSGFLLNRMMSIRQAPMVMQESAALKKGQWALPT